MLSKATYLMQDHLRYSYALITDVHVPRVFLVRGRLPFPQGLVAVSRWFAGCTAADVYAHRYFVERQSDAGQPSPSLHLTEEVQSVCKVVSGLCYMRDDHAKLDNTMVFMTDSSVVVRGRMLRFADAGSARVRRRPHATGEDKATTSSTTTASAATAAATMARVRRSMTTMPYAVPGVSNSNTTTTAAGGASAMGAAAAARSSDTFGFVKRGSASPAVRSRFPSTEQSCQDAEACHAFFRVVQQQRNEQALRATNASNSSSSSSSSTADEEGYELVETEGAYTVLYNPIEVNETTFGDVLDKLYYEGRTVACIVVPSRQTWRQLQVWADAFPDAEIVTSHCIPTTAATTTTSTQHDDKDNDGSHTRHEHAATAATAGQRGGIRDLGNGVMGMHFPDMSEDDTVTTTTTQQQQQQGTCTSSDSEATRHGRDDNDDNDNDPADVLWDAGSRAAMASLHTPHAGLRAADAARMRVLCNSSASAIVAQPRVQLTPTLTLHHIAGDAVTDEYVLHDAVSGVLACTDVFHGTYGDYDPVNSWMCRVWFKFMKKGNHKRIDCVPRYKWLQVTRQQRTLPQLRDCVDALTRTCAMRHLVAAHGTPPHGDDAANALRRQWGMPALPMAQLPPWSPAS